MSTQEKIEEMLETFKSEPVRIYFREDRAIEDNKTKKLATKIIKTCHQEMIKEIEDRVDGAITMIQEDFTAKEVIDYLAKLKKH